MPSKVYVNVEDHRLLDGKRTIEDVTKVGLPTIKHPTTTISASGMVADVDMPNMTRLEAMEYTITHNNGAGCRYLGTPGKHSHEFRVARQYYDTKDANVKLAGAKFRLAGMHVETQKGDVETGSPFGSTERYSMLRYEEERNGEVIILIDIPAGIIKFGNKDYASEVKSLLE